MQTKRRKDQQRCREDRQRQGPGPLPPLPQAKVRDDIDKPGQRVEPQNERDVRPYLKPARKRRLARNNRQKAEGSRNTPRDAQQYILLRYRNRPPELSIAPTAPQTVATPRAGAKRPARRASSGWRCPAQETSAGWRHLPGRRRAAGRQSPEDPLSRQRRGPETRPEARETRREALDCPPATCARTGSTTGRASRMWLTAGHRSAASGAHAGCWPRTRLRSSHPANDPRFLRQPPARAHPWWGSAE